MYFFPVDSVADAEEAAFWVYFTPVGHHSVGNNQLGNVYTGNTVGPTLAPGQTPSASPPRAVSAIRSTGTPC